MGSHTAGQVIPPPPPGFDFDEPPIPPPPAGFDFDEPPARAAAPTHSTAPGPQMILPEEEVQKPRPPVMATLMPRIAGTGTYRARNGGPQLTVPEARPPDEKMPGGGPTLNAPAGPETMPLGQLAGELANKPLIDPETFEGGKTADNVGGYAVDAAQSGLSAAAGMTSPANLAIMVATMGLGAVPGILARLGSAGVSAYFATEAGKAALQQFPELKHHAEQGDWHAVAANAGAIAANVAMGVGAGIHGAGEVGKALSGAPGEGPVAAAPQEAPPPPKVKRPSPATPNAPTAMTATAPESPETIAIQVGQLGRYAEPVQPGQRKAVMFPKGEGMPAYETLRGVAITHDEFGNTYLYRPDLIEPGDIHRAAKNNTLPEVLGGPEGMGAPDKSAMEDPTHAVVARGPDGTEAQATATDEANLPQTVQATSHVVPEGGTLGVEPINDVVAERAGEAPTEAPPPPPEAPPPEAPPPAEAAPGDLPPDGEAGFINASALIPPVAEEAFDWAAQAATEIQRAVAPQTLDAGAKTTAGRMREMFGKRLILEARAKAAFDKYKAIFYKQAPELGVHALSVIDAIEDPTGQGIAKLDPEGVAYADSIRRAYDDRWKKLNALGRVKDYLENYYTHLYADQGAAQRYVESWQSRRPIAGGENFRKQRVYPTFREALTPAGAAGGPGGGGLKPRFDNPVDFLLAGLAQMDKAITGHEFFAEQKPNGVFSRGAVPAGMSRVDDRIFTVFGPKHGAVKLPADAVNAGMTPEEVEVYGHREMGHWYFPDAQAQVMNNYLRPGIENGRSLYDAWMKVKGGMNQLNLGFSAFHGATTTLNSSFSDMALGLQQLTTRGKRGAGLKSLGQGSVPLLSVIRDTLRGKALIEAYDGTAANPDPSTLATVEALKAAGGSPHQATYNQSYFRDSLKKAIAQGRYASAAARALNPLLYAEMVDRIAPIMTKLVPRAKVAAFEKAWALEQERHPNMPIEEVRARAGKIWDSMDNRFGQLNQRNMLMNNMFREVMNATVGRPGWFIGTAREVLGGVADAGKTAKDFAQGRDAELSSRTAYTLAMVLGGAAINGVTTAILTGTLPKGMDYIAPRDGGVTEDGRPSRIVLPMYLSKDIYSWSQRPIATALAKLAPGLTIAGQLATNRDFYGHKIAGEGGIGVGSYLLSQSLPYSVQGVLLNRGREQPVSKTVLPMLGIMPGSKAMGLSKAETILAQYNEDHREATSAPPSEHSRQRTKVYLAAKRGDIAGARAIAREGIQKGLLTPNDARHSLDRALAPAPMVADLKRLPTDNGGLSVILRVFDAATPEERAKIQQVVRAKLISARGKGWEWDDPKVRQLAEKYFNVRPPSRDLATPPAIQ